MGHVLHVDKWPMPAAPTESQGVERAQPAIREKRLEDALIRLRDCDWVISLPDRMDAVRAIAREALEGE